MREMSKELNTEANTAAKEFLKPEQLHRLHQINHQVQGAAGFHRRARPDQAQADRLPED